MDWKKYVDHIYYIHTKTDNCNDLELLDIVDSDIFSEYYYVVDNKFNNYKYFKDIAVIEVIKDAYKNNYDSILIIRDNVTFKKNFEKDLSKCTNYLFSILNKGDICEDIWLIKKPIITYIAELFNKENEVKSYFEDDYELVNSNYSLTNWNSIFFNKLTDNIKINKINICNHKIDFVISYVNSSDIEWQKLYNEAKNTNETFNNVNRWRDFGFLEYNIILLNKYLKWLNNIYIIVSQSSQVPDWVSKYKNVKIVYHKDYIPEQLLPTFNSCVIESYLFNIPNLSEYFIYGNDDTFCINQISPLDFFENGKIKTNIVDLGEVNTNHLQICKNSFKLLLNDFSTEYFSDICLDKHFKRLTHIPHPMLKSTGTHIYAMYNTHIDEVASKFRANNNVNQYMYDMYDYLQGNYILTKLLATYCDLDNVTKIKKTMNNPDIKFTCINDTKVNYSNQDDVVNGIVQIFDQKINS